MNRIIIIICGLLVSSIVMAAEILEPPKIASFNVLPIITPNMTQGDVEKQRVNLVNLDNGIPNSNLNTGSAITFGDGINANNNLDAYILSGAYVNTVGFVNYNPA